MSGARSVPTTQAGWYKTMLLVQLLPKWHGSSVSMARGLYLLGTNERSRFRFRFRRSSSARSNVRCPEREEQHLGGQPKGRSGRTGGGASEIQRNGAKNWRPSGGASAAHPRSNCAAPKRALHLATNVWFSSASDLASSAPLGFPRLDSPSDPLTCRCWRWRGGTAAAAAAGDSRPRRVRIA